MGHTLNKFKAHVDSYTEEFGYSIAYTIGGEEFVGTFEGSLDEFYSIGYIPASWWLEAAKYHYKTGRVHDYSFRKVDSNNPRWQWHVHLWENKGGSYQVSSHYELRPDPYRIGGEDYQAMTKRLQTHYSPTYDKTYILGDTCDQLGEIL